MNFILQNNFDRKREKKSSNNKKKEQETTMMIVFIHTQKKPNKIIDSYYLEQLIFKWEAAVSVNVERDIMLFWN